MDYTEKQMEALNKKITARISNLEASIIDLKRRQRDNEFVYGVGGAYRRKENAIVKREKEITELKEFLKQIKKRIRILYLYQYDWFYRAAFFAVFGSCLPGSLGRFQLKNRFTEHLNCISRIFVMMMSCWLL